ncbi:unnamed protein product [Mytilus coruscus]|uniref:Ig-like domain-containing protein n=1 Tax=Mytilus coruscus TaxID=42192 RepID=A0A6J8DQD6_MYTCO|nr:unnamed protein product [Mytilus coruscus]
MSSYKFMNSETWFNGPKWLAHEEQWPHWDRNSDAMTTITDNESEEINRQIQQNDDRFTVVKEVINIEKFSSYPKLPHLVLTKGIIYKTVGSKVKLVCPIETTRAITWVGPPKYKIYAIGTDVSSDVSTLLEINETATDKKSILFIHRFTEEISGEFRCSDGVNEREFNLVIKKNPSDLVIVNATDDRITTVQGREHNLECRVTRGQPGGNITWSTDGDVVARNGPSFVGYRLIPQRSYNGKLFKCEAFNSEGESILESSVILEVFYAPTIDIAYFPSTRTMKCFPSGVPDSYVFKDWENTTEYNDHIRFLATTKEGNNATLTIPQNKKDHHRERGIYICRASNNISSTDGIFVMQKYNLNLPGDFISHYVKSSTENTQNGIYLETTKIKINVVSVPEYTSYVVYKNGTKFTNYTESVCRNMKLMDNIYGKNVLVKGSIISFTDTIYNIDVFSSYNIVVKNAVGCSNHTIELVSALS